MTMFHKFPLQRYVASCATILALAFAMLFSAGTAKAQEGCDFTVGPDPLVLISIDYIYTDGGYMSGNASNCVFVADVFYAQYPLEGYPLTPLGLNIDTWFLYDNGGPLPGFPPYSAVGDMVFVASNGTDQTTKDGLVILTVY